MRGLTQSQLAKAAGIDQSHIAVLEAGSRQPSRFVLDSLANILELPPSYFHQPARAHLSGETLRYRAKASLGKRTASRIRNEAEHLLDIALFLAETVNRVPTRLRPSVSDPAQAARTLRGQMQPSPNGPLPHLIRNLEKLGGIVIALPAEENLDAFAEWGGRLRDIPVVAVADGVPADRLRMNVAHEIGHLVLHKDALLPEKEAERQAFQFASELLMPSGVMRRDFETFGTDIEALLRLKKKWGVSVQALVRCARDIGHISERHYRTLNARVARLGWKREEPAEAERFDERPFAVRRMAEVAFGSPLPFRKMERALHVPEAQLKLFFSRYLGSPQPVNVSRPSALVQ